MARSHPVQTFLSAALPGLLLASLGCSQQGVPPDAGPGLLRPAAGSIPREGHAAAPSGPGALEGRVVWKGPAPVLAPLPTNASVRSVCGESVPDLSLRLDAAGGVADVVVWVEGPPDAEPGRLPVQEVLLDQRACAYRPAVMSARAGSVLRLRNSDPLTHTVHATRGGQTVFNVAMPLERMELTRTLPPVPGVVDIRCDVHPWMHASVRTFDHPHFTTTDAQGRFRIPSLPLGEEEVRTWHPRLGESGRRIRVGEGVTEVSLEVGGRP
jgi:plastocyanin